MSRTLIEAMAKHLPPSASTLRLLDVSGAAGEILRERRPDLSVSVGATADENSFDAVVYDAALDAGTLAMALQALRPGGRLIAVDAAGEPSADLVKVLEQAGYVRILVEEMLPTGVLMRGEKPHATDDTLERIQSVAARDVGGFKGRYVHLLIRQTPNKPVWALKPGDSIEWQAVALAENGAEPRLLAFSSLPNAVAFMQPAVIASSIKDVNKVAKFSRETAQNWHLLVNPPVDVLQANSIIFVPVDPRAAETPDE